jgi:uncharacterized membrane protein YeaQ/YmgE (transglycosylase-associated protein family)
MTINLGQLLVWIMVGAIAGFLAGQIFRRRGFGTIGNVVVGLFGALLGGVLAQALNIRIPDMVKFEFTLGDIIIAVIGALILLIIMQLIQRRR